MLSDLTGRRWLPLLLIALLCACGHHSDEDNPMEEMRLRTVTLPNGTELKCEVMIKQDQMARGMMFRDAMPPQHGMLFIHVSPGRYPYWMYHVKVPLDIIWMDQARQIVEISPNTPPCTAARSADCPTYGGHQPAAFVLELNGGEARKYGLHVGQTLTF
jgi:hypothetical protein